jgi:hypothetical protein
MNPDLHQIEHGLLRELLRRFLVAELESARGTGGIRRVGSGAATALDSLLAAHSVDRRVKCRLCRGPGWLERRRRVCLVFLTAHYWLRHPPGQLAAQLAREAGIGLLPGPYVADPQIIQMQAGITADPSGDPSLTPAVPRPLALRRIPEAGWSDPDHGGAGEPSPDSPQSRRGPSASPSPGPGVAVLLTGGVTELLAASWVPPGSPSRT